MKENQIKQQRIYNNKGVSALSWVLYHLLPYRIYTKVLPLSLKDDSATPKTKTNWLTRLTEKIFKKREPINYNFNMKDFFTLDGKIEENRRFLRETQDKYEKIRNYYPLFFIYIGVIGYYSFKILSYLILNANESFGYLLFSMFFIIHVLLFSYILIQFGKLIFPKDVAIEPLPIVNYKDYDSKKTKNKKENKKTAKYEKKCILASLERDNEDNLNILVKKKKILNNIIKLSFFSFILYIGLITTYHVDMTKKENSKKKPKVVLKPKQTLKEDKIIDFTDTSITENPGLLKVKDFQERLDEIK